MVHSLLAEDRNLFIEKLFQLSLYLPKKYYYIFVSLNGTQSIMLSINGIAWIELIGFAALGDIQAQHVYIVDI